MGSSSFYDAWNASLSACRANHGVQAGEGLPPIRLLGLMSGTSLDGVDACLVTLAWENSRLVVSHIVHHGVTLPWPLRETLLRVQQEKSVSVEEISRLNVKLGELFAEVALQALEVADETPESITAIASHGLTVAHYPPRGDKPGHTLQLGHPAIIAERTGIATVADFRPRDMAAGGQGAPLVPFADWLLFGQDGVARCVQNLGGIGNVAVLPVDPTAPLLAFDTGPGNMLLDGAVRALFGRAFDPMGGIASAGQVNEALLHALKQHPYLKKSPPKSTGREAFGDPYLLPLLEAYAPLPKEDILATLSTFTAWTVADAYARFVFPAHPVAEVLLCGGGVHNQTLMRHLKQAVQQVAGERILRWRTPEDYGIPNAAKEALAFAVLGWAAYWGLPNNRPDCTGASKPVVLGSWTGGAQGLALPKPLG